MEKETIVMRYISIWNWHITAIIFLTAGLIVVSTAQNLMGDVFFIAFIASFLISEYISLFKKRKLLKIKMNKRGASLWAYLFWIILGFIIGAAFFNKFMC